VRRGFISNAAVAPAASILGSFNQSRFVHTHADVHNLELKIPPLGLVIVAAFFMWLGAAYSPTLNYRFPFQSLVAWVIGLSGALACALGIIQFNRAKTTVDPTKPESASTLVRTGIYRRTRNPMYLGFSLILVGWAIAMTNVVAFVVPPAFVIYMNRFQIKPEERALTLIFGEDFKAYCVETRRWI
jgi:protein-S-isoprenylcysteine O-methyltransferase Ste14